MAAEPRVGAIRAGAIYVEVVRDDRLADGFRWGRCGALPDALIAAVRACPHAALIEVTQRLDACADRLVQVGRALQAAGGIAIRMEASGAASAWEPWLEGLASGSPGAIYAASVVIARDEDTFFTCGMHQFDLPDAEIAADDASSAVDWLDSFGVFQLEEQPTLSSGHTFRPNGHEDRRVLERWPDHRHPPDDGRCNPYGLWRFLPVGVRGLEALDPVPTIVPSLAATLTAAEQSKRAALTKAEVDLLVNTASAISMSARDVRELERQRGYADIEPRLAWQQWQLIRQSLV